MKDLNCSVNLKKRLKGLFYILSLSMLALSLNACFVKTSIPTTEVRIEPIRQLSKDEYFLKLGYIFDEKNQKYVNKDWGKIQKKELEREKLIQHGFEDETLQDLDNDSNYKIIKDKYIVYLRSVNAGPGSYWHTNLIRLKEKDYEIVFSGERNSRYAVSDDEKYILICDDQKKFKIFDTDEDLKELKEFEHIKCNYAFLSFDNRYLIVTNYEDNLQIYDFKTQELIYDNPSIYGLYGDSMWVYAKKNKQEISKDYILFTDGLPQRFLIKEMNKGFIDFDAIKNRIVDIADISFENNEAQILLKYCDMDKIKEDIEYYYLAKLVPINKNKK